MIHFLDSEASDPVKICVERLTLSVVYILTKFAIEVGEYILDIN